MALTIPTRTDTGRYRFSIELSGVVFVFVFSFNRRDDHWYFDLLDNAGEAIRSGVRVTPNFPLLRQLVQQGRPDGLLFAIDPQGNLEPGLEDLGGQVKLTYDDGTGA
jgi:hypothetical protein